MEPMDADLSPGAFVRHPGAPEWGTGQVQSLIGTRVTVSFEHRGQLVLDLRMTKLVPAPPPSPPLVVRGAG
jgi:hypothetical protein